MITCVSNNSEEAIERAKQTLAFYISVGKIYREFLAKNGFEKETLNIFEEFKKIRIFIKSTINLDSMLKELTISELLKNANNNLRYSNKQELIYR